MDRTVYYDSVESFDESEYNVSGNSLLFETEELLASFLCVLVSGYCLTVSAWHNKEYVLMVYYGLVITPITFVCGLVCFLIPFFYPLYIYWWFKKCTIIS
ncbi:hypothetical protein SAGO17_00102 [Mimivirus AB-566-O17]|uniref:Uncharacterized protein n=1 Tax=Mimivirus AB-566-O17 TaxID=1988039 RepID=A0A1X9VNY4_9VIRU|nr:hypothetical protein SAGO17_00102 [Mimivirus AB-566-O17]